MTSTKYCKDCRYCQKTGHTLPPHLVGESWRSWLCIWKSETINPVNGDHESPGQWSLCEYARKDAGHCTAAGLHFEPAIK